jgi:hypothetical protein
MRHTHRFGLLIVTTGCLAALASPAAVFEGQISAAIIRGKQTDALLYTVGTNSLRVEMTATNWPNPVDILDRNSGTLTLLFPNNRSFLRLPPATDATPAPGMPMPPGGLPPGIGPQSAAAAPAMPNIPVLPPGAGAQPQVAPGSGLPVMPPRPAMPNMPGASGMPAMPMPMMPAANVELLATGQKTNLLGFACERYEIKQRGETMEIWATDQLLPFQPYVPSQPHRFGPRMIEEQWAESVKARKLFPLLATLKLGNGTERFRFEVQAIKPRKLADADAGLFQPPANYLEIQPLPF